EILVELTNRLLMSEAHQYGIPLSATNVTVRVDDPDGGADALTNTGGIATPNLRQGKLVWQCKKRWPRHSTKSGLDKELQKRAVQAAFEDGAGYSLVVGESKSANTQLDRATRLENEARTAGCRGPVQLLHADQVTAWASGVPAAVLALRPAVQGFRP